MFGYLHIACSPLLHYADAAAKEASIKPIRGRSVECKPLGKRTQTWLTIAKVGDNIEIRRGSGPHASTLLTYLPDGTIKIRPNRYPCNTTNQIFHRVLGYRHTRFAVHDRNTWVHANYKDEDTTTQGWLPVVEELVFKWEERSNGHILVLQNPTLPKKHTINRKKANIIRKKPEYAPFRKYLSATMKLVEDKHGGHEETLRRTSYSLSSTNPFFSEGAYIALFGVLLRNSKGEFQPALDWHGNPRPNHITNIPRTPVQEQKEYLTLVSSTDAADNYKALMHLMRWLPKTEAAALKAFDTILIKVHAGEVMEVETVRTGKLVKDPNRHFVGG
jgi:hypothetical protein